MFFVLLWLIWKRLSFHKKGKSIVTWLIKQTLVLHYSMLFTSPVFCQKIYSYLLFTFYATRAKNWWESHYDACKKGVKRSVRSLWISHRFWSTQIGTRCQRCRDMDDSKLNCMVTAVVKRKKPSKVQLSQLSEVNRRIYKAKWVQFSSFINSREWNPVHFPKSSHWGSNITKGSIYQGSQNISLFSADSFRLISNSSHHVNNNQCHQINAMLTSD